MRSKINYLLYSCLVLMTLFFMSCAMMDSGGGAASSGRVRYPNKVTGEMQQKFDVIENDFKNKKYAEAFKAYQEYLKAYPYNKLSDTSAFRLGQIYMLQRKYQQAIDQFNRLIDKTPDPQNKSKSYVKAGICYYRLNDYTKAVGAFKNIDANLLVNKDKAKAFALSVFARTYLKQSLDAMAYDLAVLLDVYQGMSSEDLDQEFGGEVPPKTAVVNKLEEWARKATPLENIEPRLLKYHYKGKPSEPYILFKLAKSYQAAGNSGKAKSLLKTYASKYSTGTFSGEVQAMLSKLGGSTPLLGGGKQINVGVLLPLSGKYSVFGQNTLKGMECATGARVECTGVKNIRIIQKDDGGEPATAAAAVVELVQKHKVSVILGPISSSVAEAAAKKAEDMGVVLISLAQKTGVASIGNHIFSFGLTPETQVQNLLRYVTERRKVKSIAVLYPNNNYGMEFSKQMAKFAGNYQAKIVDKISFNPDGDLMDLSAKIPSGIDAVFIPDSFSTIVRLSEVLKGANMQNTIVMGTNAWNDDKIVNSHLSNMVFLDSFFNQAADSDATAFVQQYRAAYGQNPTTLEAMGYDAIRFVAHAFKGKKVKNAEEAYNRIANINNFKGVTGLRGFKSDRRALIAPYLLTVRNGAIKEL